MMIVISVIVTGIVMTMAWSAGVEAQMTSQYAKMDRAFFAAESGIQQVAWYCKHNKMGLIHSPLTGTVNGYGYSASWVTVSGNTIRITCVGSLGDASCTASQNVTPPGVAAVTLTSGGGGNISGAVTVNGDLQTIRDVNANGNLHVTGNLTTQGRINGSPVAGSKKPGQTGLTTPSVLTIYNNAKALATNTLDHPSSISTLDFGAAPNGVIWVNGDANMSSNVNVIGSGTVVVAGNWNQSGNFPKTGTANVNVVVHGDLNVSGSLKITGSLYGGGNWNQSGTFAVTGVVLVTGDSNVSGAGTITNASPPTFDGRGAGGGTVFAKFGGVDP